MRSQIEIVRCVRHLIPVFGEAPPFVPDVRIRTVHFVSGTSHGDPFGAVVVAPDNLDPRVEMFGRERFDRQEAMAVGLKAMIMPRHLADEIVEHPEAGDEAQAAELVTRLKDEGRKAFCGERVALDVPAGDRERAKALGARWDGDLGAWYAFSGLADIEELDEWLQRAPVPA
ncbi:MAG: hypothetical protein EOR63_32225 [Mesorhizobium sp.]|nr:MAG: hypothetical protein EOR63_32225 [Mesorhizobium sp.]